MNDLTNDPFLGTADLAEQLDVAEVTVESWRQRRCGPPYIKVGRLVRYRKSDVDRWLQEQTVTAA